jgi:tRNA-dihydrouridine synthase 3
MLDFRDQVLLAPLTKGGNLPFRRLCVDFGAVITCSEMAYARQLVRGKRSEFALLRKHESETCFGVQLAVGRVEDGLAAGRTAIERGAAFVDVNAGCPIHDVVRRGMGATLLQRPAAFARLVEALVDGLDVPVTVKIRAGWNERTVNASEIARILEEAGAAAVTLHPRTREQRYTKAADWQLVRQLASERSIPIIGNGDLLTWHETEHRKNESGCASVMLARGALIKPWLFREIRDRRTWLPTATERIAVYRQLTSHMKEHFGADARGRKRAMFFLPWHVGFFCRYRPMPDEHFVERARAHPLLQTRLEPTPDLPPLDALLHDAREGVHERIAETLWDSTDDADAEARLATLAADVPPTTDPTPDIEVAQG